MSLLYATFKRDIRLGLRRKAQIMMPPVFFLMIVTLFPLALGPDQSILSTIAPGVLVVSALLASLLPLDTLFRDDDQDGSLDLLLLSGSPLVIGLHSFFSALLHISLSGLCETPAGVSTI